MLQNDGMAVRKSSQYFQYRTLNNDRVTLSEETKLVEDGDGSKVRFTNEYSYIPTQFDLGDGFEASLDDLLRTTKGKCLFHADAGHGQACGPLCNPEVFQAEKGYNSTLELRETRDMGIGVFAKQNIPCGTVLGLFSGAVRPYGHLTPAQKPYSNFLFRHPEHGELYVDASAGGNWTRFMNHSCEPNCAFARALRCGHTRVIYARTRRDVQAGEELFVDYGVDYFEGSTECRCGSGRCLSIKSGPKRERDGELDFYEGLFSDEFRETVRVANPQSPRRHGLRAKVKVRRVA